MFKIIFAEKAKKRYDALSEDIRKKVNVAIGYLGVCPFLGPHIKKLKGELKGYYRYRVGDFRIIYSFNKDTVFVKVIEHRGKAY